MPAAVIDTHIRDYGVKGLTPFAEFLSYWNTALCHLLEYMHIQKNNWQRVTEMMFGRDVDTKTIQAMRDLFIHPNVTREVNPDSPHWRFPPEIEDVVAHWIRALKLPRDWCNDHGAAFKGA